MIVFHTIRWRNFLSTGDKFTEIQLDRSPSTLIVGHNGAGKSTLLDALSFALFGKPHRNINKPQLVNSINGKNCVVEVEFTIGSHAFKIVRGLKPGVFEIYQNGHMINQSAATKDYQLYLEKNILKLNHKSFHQIVVLGASSFIPFMQLPSGHRREVIEDLLDINIFTKMNVVLKEKVSSLKEEFNTVTHKLETVAEKIVLQKKFIKELEDMNDRSTDLVIQEIDSLNTEIERLQAECVSINDSIDVNESELETKSNQLVSKREKMNSYIDQFKQQAKTLVKEAKFYDEHSHCPTCDQDISDELKQKKIQEATTKAKELKSAIDKATDENVVINNSLTDIGYHLKAIREKQTKVSSNLSAIAQIQKHVDAKNKQIAELYTSDNSELVTAKVDLTTLEQEKTSIGERRLSVLESRTYYDACYEMLKDTGIKTKIIKQYLPVMNTLINKYLQVLDFFVQFQLDENFDETIRSRYRDEFTYSSFSEGEKSRLDLALLFTWRQIAKMKNSTATNLVILDETFDSSLDQDGTDNLLKILGTLPDDTNIFIISHKVDLLDGKFRSKIEFEKKNNFSVMKA